jgi:hypothetical protein
VAVRGASIAILILAATTFFLTACGTISQVEHQPAAASWDGSEQNSGLVSDANSSMVVTPHWRDRYNALVVLYGAQFRPALVADQGLTAGAPGGNWYANHFARIHMYVMNTWDHSAMHGKVAGQ